MKRNIKLFPIYKLFSYDILFYYSISILYLTGIKHYTLSQVALASSIQAVAAVIWKIPASIITDRIGYKSSMVIGNISRLVWCFIYIVAPSFYIVLIAEFLYAFGTSLRSASETPLIYSSLVKENMTSEYSKVEGRGSSYYFIAEAIASITAGYLYHINVYLPLILASICSLVATILAILMKKIPTFNASIPTGKERVQDILHGFKFIFKSKRLHALFLFAAVFKGIIALGNLYIKSFLNDINVSSTLFGYIFALASIASAIGSIVPDKIKSKYKNKTLSVISISFLLSFIIIGICSLIFKSFYILLSIGIVIFLLQTFIRGAYRIIVKEYATRYTTTSIRSKLMSIYYLIECLGSAVLTFIASETIDLIPIGLSYCIFGILLLIIVCLILSYMNKRIGLEPEKYTPSDRMDLQEVE